MSHRKNKVETWWKSGWFWFLVSGPLIVVVAGILTVYIAYHGADEVIRDNPLENKLTVQPKTTPVKAPGK